MVIRSNFQKYLFDGLGKGHKSDEGIKEKKGCCPNEKGINGLYFGLRDTAVSPARLYVAAIEHKGHLYMRFRNFLPS